MPTMKLYLNGASAHTAGGSGSHIRALRGEVKGWNAATAARQRKWLWTVDSDALDGQGYALTLTVRDCPPDAATWAVLRGRWLKALSAHGVTRVHWVTEWQARGVPHMHAAVYVDRDKPELHRGGTFAALWCVIAQEYGAELQGQDAKLIEGSLGWLKYLSKHASRGASHYQRQGHPEAWNKSGRLWGHTGSWPVVEPTELSDLAPHEFYRVRRLMRSWAIADARKVEDWGRVAFLRAAPGRIREPKMSRFQGVSEWIPEPVALRLVDYLERENT